MEEKKINKKFYILSAINILPAIILGGGATMDSLVLVGALAVLICNHVILVTLVKSMTQMAAEEGRNASRKLGRVLFLMLMKFVILFGLITVFYLYKNDLMTKLFLIIFFQLIIQVVSIKNNYQNS